MAGRYSRKKSRIVKNAEKVVMDIPTKKLLKITERKVKMLSMCEPVWSSDFSKQKPPPSSNDSNIISIGSAQESDNDEQEEEEDDDVDDVDDVDEENTNNDSKNNVNINNINNNNKNTNKSKNVNKNSQPTTIISYNRMIRHNKKRSLKFTQFVLKSISELKGKLKILQKDNNIFLTRKLERSIDKLLTRLKLAMDKVHIQNSPQGKEFVLAYNELANISGNRLPQKSYSLPNSISSSNEKESPNVLDNNNSKKKPDNDNKSNCTIPLSTLSKKSLISDTETDDFIPLINSDYEEEDDDDEENDDSSNNESNIYNENDNKNNFDNDISNSSNDNNKNDHTFYKNNIIDDEFLVDDEMDISLNNSFIFNDSQNTINSSSNTNSLLNDPSIKKSFQPESNSTISKNEEDAPAFISLLSDSDESEISENYDYDENYFSSRLVLRNSKSSSEIINISSDEELDRDSKDPHQGDLKETSDKIGKTPLNKEDLLNISLLESKSEPLEITDFDKLISPPKKYITNTKRSTFTHKETPPLAARWIARPRKQPYTPPLNGYDRLTEDINDFISYLSPTLEESMLRQSAVSRVRSLVSRLWRDANTQVFGSFSTGLYLPDSDLDLVITSPSKRLNSKRSLFVLAGRLKASGYAFSVDVISRARVPIVKFTDQYTKLHVDISFERESGLVSTQTINHWLSHVPGLRELTIIIKQFLKTHYLNEVHSGGLGGFAIINMIMIFLRLHPGIKSNKIDPIKNLGLLLVDFFKFYGTQFNYEKYAISVKADMEAAFKNKMQCNWALDAHIRQPFSLAILDPNELNNNISRGTFDLISIKNSFEFAYKKLLGIIREYDADPAKTYIKCKSFLALILAYNGPKRSFVDQNAPWLKSHSFTVPPAIPNTTRFSTPHTLVNSRYIVSHSNSSNKKITFNASNSSNKSSQQKTNEILTKKIAEETSRYNKLRLTKEKDLNKLYENINGSTGSSTVKNSNQGSTTSSLLDKAPPVQVSNSLNTSSKMDSESKSQAKGDLHDKDLPKSNVISIPNNFPTSNSTGAKTAIEYLAYESNEADLDTEGSSHSDIKIYDSIFNGHMKRKNSTQEEITSCSENESEDSSSSVELVNRFKPKKPRKQISKTNEQNSISFSKDNQDSRTANVVDSGTRRQYWASKALDLSIDSSFAMNSSKS